MSTSPNASRLAVALFEAFARNGGNRPDDHFDRNAAEQWMQQALDECMPTPAAAQESAAVWTVTREGDPTFPRTFFSEAAADAAVAHVTLPPFAVKHAPVAAATGIDLATAWAEGYESGVMDECISEANIGIAGFGAKIAPARANPYLIDASPKGGNEISNLDHVDDTDVVDIQATSAEAGKERCESGSPDCGPVEHWDSEAVPLCARCWKELTASHSARVSG